MGPISDDPRGGGADIDWLLRFGGEVPDHEPRTTPGEWANLAGETLGGLAVPAGWLGRLGTLGRGAPEAGILASRTGKLYDFPTNSEVGHAWAGGNSRGLDLEGRPLVARYVVGRTPDSEVERALHPSVLNEISERFTGSPVEAVPAASLPRRAVGAVDVTRRGSLENPRVRADLAPDQFRKAAAHARARDRGPHPQMDQRQPEADGPDPVQQAGRRRTWRPRPPSAAAGGVSGDALPHLTFPAAGPK